MEPGPTVPMQTARSPVSWACALAANAATSSWRTPIHSRRSSRRIASVTGLRASPTTPQTDLTPWLARASTMTSATVLMDRSAPGARQAGAEGGRVGGGPVGRPRLRGLGDELARGEPLEELGVGPGLPGADHLAQLRRR